MPAKTVLVRPQDLRSRACAPTCLFPPPCYATDSIKMPNISGDKKKNKLNIEVFYDKFQGAFGINFIKIIG